MSGTAGGIGRRQLAGIETMYIGRGKEKTKWQRYEEVSIHRGGKKGEKTGTRYSSLFSFSYQGQMWMIIIHGCYDTESDIDKPSYRST